MGAGIDCCHRPVGRALRSGRCQAVLRVSLLLHLLLPLLQFLQELLGSLNVLLSVLLLLLLVVGCCRLVVGLIRLVGLIIRVCESSVASAESSVASSGVLTFDGHAYCRRHGAAIGVAVGRL